MPETVDAVASSADDDTPTSGSLNDTGQQSDADAGPNTTVRGEVTKRVIRVPYVSDSKSPSERSRYDVAQLPDVNEPGEVATPVEESETAEAPEHADESDEPPASVAEAVSPAEDDGQMPPPSGEEERDTAQVGAAERVHSPRPEASETPQSSKRWWQFWRV